MLLITRVRKKEGATEERIEEKEKRHSFRCGSMLNAYLYVS